MANIFDGNPVLVGTGTEQPRKVEDIKRRNKTEDLVINGGKARLDLVGQEKAAESASGKEFEDIEAIDGDTLEALKCGDFVVKKTVDGDKELFHTYFVTHKQATGICLSYFAAGYLETISYDKVDGTWTFNSKDVWQAQ